MFDGQERACPLLQNVSTFQAESDFNFRHSVVRLMPRCLAAASRLPPKRATTCAIDSESAAGEGIGPDADGDLLPSSGAAVITKCGVNACSGSAARNNARRCITL